MYSDVLFTVKARVYLEIYLFIKHKGNKTKGFTTRRKWWKVSRLRLTQRSPKLRPTLIGFHLKVEFITLHLSWNFLIKRYNQKIWIFIEVFREPRFLDIEFFLTVISSHAFYRNNYLVTQDVINRMDIESVLFVKTIKEREFCDNRWP